MRNLGLTIIWIIVAGWTYLIARSLVVAMPGCAFTTPQTCSPAQLSSLGFLVIALLVIWAVVATPLTVIALYLRSRPRLSRGAPEIVTSCVQCGAPALICDEVCGRCGTPLPVVTLDRARRRADAVMMIMIAIFSGLYIARGAASNIVDSHVETAKLYTERLQ